MTELSEAYALCRRVAHRYGANFSVGFRFLPKAKRDAVYAAYAFCRFVDDVVDENPGADVRARIDRWEDELESCYRGEPTHDITVALADTVSRYPVPKSAFGGLIEGCRMDLVKNRYEDFDDLMIYSDLVATTISTMSLAIFGYRDEEAVSRGRDLATAFQLTNILRDVGEDIGKDRVYLPQDELGRFGVNEGDLRAKRVTPEFRELMRFQVQRVRDYYHRAEPLLEMIAPDARRCTCLMGTVYYEVLGRIEARGYEVFGSRIGLTLPEKVAIVARTYLEKSPHVGKYGPKESVMKKRFFLLFIPVVLALGLVAAVRSQGVDQGEVSRMVELLDVDPGEVFADVGAGDGRFSVALAKVVGENGTIYATEVDPNDLKKIEERVESEKVSNIDVVRGTQEGTGLPDHCCDGILLRRVYHHFQDPQAMQASLRRALRENGLLLVIDFGTKRRWSRPSGIPASRKGHGIDEEMLLSEMKKAGFELVKDLRWENGDYALLFRARPVTD